MTRYVLLVSLALGSGAALTNLGAGMQSAVEGLTQGSPVATALAPRVGSQRQAGLASGLSRGKLLAKFDPPSAGPIKAIFLDADGTVRKTIGSRPPNIPDEVELLANVGAVTRKWADEGYFVAIVSNQAGIERGYLTAADADATLKRTVDLIQADGGVVHYFTFSESKSSPAYKPGTGMLEEVGAFAQQEFGRSIDWRNSIMVGDASYKRGKGDALGDLRPDRTRGDDFSNSDRRLAVNAERVFGEPLPYEEARFFFGREPKSPAYLSGQIERGAAAHMVRLLSQEWLDFNISTGDNRFEFWSLAKPDDLEEAALTQLNVEGLRAYARDRGWSDFGDEVVEHELEKIYPSELEDAFIEETARRVATDGFAYSPSFSEGIISLRENVRQTLRLLQNGDREPLRAIRSTVQLEEAGNSGGRTRRATRTLFINPNTLDAVSVISREGSI